MVIDVSVAKSTGLTIVSGKSIKASRRVGKLFTCGVIAALFTFSPPYGLFAATTASSASALVADLKSAVDKLAVDQPKTFQRLNQTVVHLSSIINQLNLVTSTVLTIPTGTHAKGSTFDIPISFVSGSIQPAALQADILLPTGVTINSVKAGMAATDAGKQVSYSNKRFLVFGLNQTLLNAGDVVIVNVTLGASIASGILPLSLTNPIASDKDGISIPMSVMSGSIVVR